jgi:hypothetical protein
MRIWTKPFAHKNRCFEATFVRNPHKGGLEVIVSVEGRNVRVVDLAMNEKGMIERVKAEIDRLHTPPVSAVAA